MKGFATIIIKRQTMRIYNKTIKLSITIISLMSLAVNILFPQAVLAETVDKKKVLNFNYTEKTNVFPFVSVKRNISLVKITDSDIEAGEDRKIFMLPIEPAIVKSNDEIAAEICAEAGIKDLPCWQDLKAMRQKESYDGKQMTGDGGRSRGWYHIQIKMHGISNECALDFKCSTEWTVKNLLAHNYETNRVYAISRHNGGGKMAQAYARNVIYNSTKFE